jgi:3-hydroxybutyryl-CoA dehydratase
VARDASAEDFAIGDWVSFDVSLRAEEVDAFAALTGDRSPIHVSQDYAEQAGFRERVVHGMLAAAFLSSVVGMFLPGRKAMLMAQKTDFIEPIPLGATITVTARVSQLSPAARAMTIALIALHGGIVVMRGSVTARIRESF